MQEQCLLLYVLYLQCSLLSLLPIVWDLKLLFQCSSLVWRTHLHYPHVRAPAAFSKKMAATAFHWEVSLSLFKYFSCKNTYRSSSYIVRTPVADHWKRYSCNSQIWAVLITQELRNFDAERESNCQFTDGVKQQYSRVSPSLWFWICALKWIF